MIKLTPLWGWGKAVGPIPSGKQTAILTLLGGAKKATRQGVARSLEEAASNIEDGHEPVAVLRKVQVLARLDVWEVAQATTQVPLDPLWVQEILLHHLEKGWWRRRGGGLLLSSAPTWGEETGLLLRPLGQGEVHASPVFEGSEQPDWGCSIEAQQVWHLLCLLKKTGIDQIQSLSVKGPMAP